MITVDSREPLVLQSIGDEVKLLPYGDFIIEINSKRLVIERKTVPDFWASLKKGRLNEQLDHSDALLIHHTIGEFTYLNPVLFYDCLNGVCNRHNIKIWHAYDADHINKILRRYESQLANDTFGVYEPVIPKLPLPTSIRILAAFDNIGIEKAKILFEQHGSVQGVLDAAYEQERTHGIGEKTLKGIVANLTEGK